MLCLVYTVMPNRHKSYALEVAATSLLVGAIGGGLLYTLQQARYAPTPAVLTTDQFLIIEAVSWFAIVGCAALIRHCIFAGARD